VQEEISMMIVDKLRVKLKGVEKGEIQKRYTEKPEAHQYYLKALYYWQMMTPEGNQKAQENYRKALETDPNYALVYSILGSNFLFAASLGFIPPEVALDALEFSPRFTRAEVRKKFPQTGAYPLITSSDVGFGFAGFTSSTFSTFASGCSISPIRRFRTLFCSTAPCFSS